MVSRSKPILAAKDPSLPANREPVSVCLNNSETLVYETRTPPSAAILPGAHAHTHALTTHTHKWNGGTVSLTDNAHLK